jgi:N-acetylmuramoyl-L-alanine amidase
MSWGDIGYHLLIDEAGVVYEGRWTGTDPYPVFGPFGGNIRPVVNTAGHALGYNVGNIGICLLGTLTAVPATAAAQTALVTVLAGLARISSIDPLGTVNYVNLLNLNTRTVRGVSGHRDWLATACPGDAFYPFLADIRSRTAALIPPPPPESGRPEPTVPDPVEGHTPPAVISPPVPGRPPGRSGAVEPALHDEVVKHRADRLVDGQRRRIDGQVGVGG